MPWLVLALIVTLLGGLSAHGSHHEVLAYFLFACTFACAFAIARLREKRRTGEWEEAADAVGGTYRGSGPYPEDVAVLRFGRAPWQTWSQAYNARCTRLIEGPGEPPDFWLLNIAYSESSSQEVDTGFELTAAVVRLGGESLGELHAVPVEGRYRALHNGKFLFLWKRARGPLAIGHVLRPRELPALLERARAVAREAAETPPLEEAERAPAERGVGYLLLVMFGWSAVIAAAFMPRYSRLDIPPLLLGALLVALGLEWRRVSSVGWFALLVAVGLVIRGVHGTTALLFFGVPIGVCLALLVGVFATSKTTRRDEKGALVWRSSRDP